MNRLVHVLGAAALLLTAVIGSKQIADDSIRSRDVRDGALRLRDLHPEVGLAFEDHTQIVGFAGPIANIPGLTGLYRFAGPTARVATSTAYPRVSGTAMAGLGLNQGTPWQFSDIGLCSRAVAESEVSLMVGDGSVLTARFVDVRDVYGATASAVLPPGTYDVGLCVRNNGANKISNNGTVNGWVQVTA